MSKQRLFGCVVAVMLLLIGAGAMYVAKHLNELLLKPSMPFAQSPVAPPPNYNEASSWAAYPGKLSPVTIDIPIEEMTLSQPIADVFYIHPTGYFSSLSWNSPMRSPGFAEEKTELMLLGQATAFNGCCNIYAPEYRQATIYAFMERATDDGTRALDLAYTDVLRAFDHFIEMRDPSLPFIIASHSQGTTHAMRILADRVDGTRLQQQMVAAYTIGYSFPDDYFSRVYETIGPCASAYDHGCVIHWDAFAEGGIDDSDATHWYPMGWERSTNKKRVCMNPLNWSSVRPAGAALNEGALVVDAEFSFLDGAADKPTGDTAELRGLETKKYGAYCGEDGLLFVTGIDESSVFFEGMAEDGSLHLYDYSLFWANLRTNALERSLTH